MFHFLFYGSWEGLDMCKMMPLGVGSFSTPGKPTSENFFCFDIFRVIISISDHRFTSMDQSMCHGGCHPATISELVDASSVYNLGRVDSSRQVPVTLETRTWTPVPNPLILEASRVNPLTHAPTQYRYPAPRCGGYVYDQFRGTSGI